ncbi:hypothetical protein BDP55DRAFT_631041 [Colletotrichum godetiae]|uniref:Uncharacterized protein n=1 Tax=Colletotrichum godetiae TaxID=1209918 RepID=A0AAJ0AN60_9PEZI|nr:uncharacterized protein BDP55DRAFT_631041 [Colletotrichum godetiae]KAK1676961.1 hypothetical protein BDP55DRAFT_631041 [Colletotrichum godetiae]
MLALLDRIEGVNWNIQKLGCAAGCLSLSDIAFQHSGPESGLSTTVGFTAVIAVCRSVEYTWDKSVDGHASAATIVRRSYLQYYNQVENYLHNIANIVLWLILECGIGIIAGSLPSFRRLLNSWLDKSSKVSYNNTGSNDLNAISGGQAGGTGVRIHNLSGRGMTVSNCQSGPHDNWVQLDDDSESQKHIIMKTQEMTLQYEREGQYRGR